MEQKSDTSLFMRDNGVDIIIILLYVDDILVIGSNDASIATQDLDATFKLKDLGSLHNSFLELKHNPFQLLFYFRK